MAKRRRISRERFQKPCCLTGLVKASKDTAVNLSQASMFLTTRVLKPVANYWPLVYPVMMFFWKRMKKRKEKKDGR